MQGDDTTISAGAGSNDVDGLCPPFYALNSNLFASIFGVEFTDDSHALVRPISPYEIARCYGRAKTHKIESSKIIIMRYEPHSQ